MNQQPVQVLASQGYHGVIEKISAVRDLDIDKLRQFMELQEQWERRQAETYWNNQMSLAQAEMTQISKDSANTITRSKYASLEALDEAIRPIYTKYGFSVSFNDETPLDRLDSSWLRLIATVRNGGHKEHYNKWLPISTTGIRGQVAMTPTHASIGAVTYGRRALLKMIFNLAEVDDDATRTAGFETTEKPEPEKFDSKATAEAIIKHMHTIGNHTDLYTYSVRNRAVYERLFPADRNQVEEVYKDLKKKFAAQEEAAEQQK